MFGGSTRDSRQNAAKCRKMRKQTGGNRQESGKKRKIFGDISTTGVMKLLNSMECRRFSNSGGFFLECAFLWLTLLNLFEG